MVAMRVNHVEICKNLTPEDAMESIMHYVFRSFP